LRPRVEQMILNRPTLNFTSLLAQPFSGERPYHKTQFSLPKTSDKIKHCGMNFRHMKNIDKRDSYLTRTEKKGLVTIWVAK
jgi:hypothetical protein